MIEQGQQGALKITIKLFASLREAVGHHSLQWEMSEGSTVRDALERLAATFPRWRSAARVVYVAVNQRYANPDTPLQDGDEVALFPPVSGGTEADARASDQSYKLFEVTTSPLSLDDVAARVNAPTRGAITIFTGVVRGITGDRETAYLEYEAYTEMAEAMLSQIGQEVQARWPQIEAVSIVHRVGHLEVGEPSVVIAVAAPHRVETFVACQYAIDRLKEIVPIWKKEVWTDGEAWVEGPSAEKLSPAVGSSDMSADSPKEPDDA